MLRKCGSSLILGIVCIALGVAPASAADTGGKMGDMAGMNMKAGGATKKMAMHSKHKMSCYDFAWQSQDMKDCLAKQGSPMPTQ